MTVTILAIDSSTSACSAALLFNGQITQRCEVGSNIHSQRLLLMVSDLLSSAGIEAEQLEAVAVGQGPGSFTGLRIGVGVAQGLAYGAGCPMIGVSSLAALAVQSEYDGVVMAGIDARMQEIYWGLYQKSGSAIQALQPDNVCQPVEVPIDKADTLIGNAWSIYESELETTALKKNNQSDILYPTAEAILNLAVPAYLKGEFVSPVDFAPQYVRNDVAKKSSKGIKA